MLADRMRMSRTGDEYAASVVSLLAYQGASGSTSILDATGKTWTSKGDAALSTARSKIGASSLYLDGSGDAITTPSNTDFDFGSGDFTMEGYVYLEANGSGWITCRRNTSTPWVPVGMLLSFGSPRLVISNYSGSAYSVDTTAGAISTGQWVHWAIYRSGSAVRASIAGTVVISASFTGPLAPLSEAVVYGAGSAAPDSPYMKGYRGWDRVTKGVCRYPLSGSFVPPNSPF